MFALTEKTAFDVYSRYMALPQVCAPGCYGAHRDV
jgi:hypothetical protein